MATLVNYTCKSFIKLTPGLCMSVDLPLGKKTVENPGLGRGPPSQAFGLAGRSRAVGYGPRVCFLQNSSNTADA